MPKLSKPNLEWEWNPTFNAKITPANRDQAIVDEIGAVLKEFFGRAITDETAGFHSLVRIPGSFEEKRKASISIWVRASKAVAKRLMKHDSRWHRLGPQTSTKR